MTSIYEDEHRKLTDVEIDNLNMNIIARNIGATMEYQATGHWTAFMGVVLDTPPMNTKLIPF